MLLKSLQKVRTHYLHNEKFSMVSMEEETISESINFFVNAK